MLRRDYHEHRRPEADLFKAGHDWQSFDLTKYHTFDEVRFHNTAAPVGSIQPAQASKIHKALTRIMFDYDKNAFLGCGWVLGAAAAPPGFSEGQEDVGELGGGQRSCWLVVPTMPPTPVSHPSFPAGGMEGGQKAS